MADHVHATAASWAASAAPEAAATSRTTLATASVHPDGAMDYDTGPADGVMCSMHTQQYGEPTAEGEERCIDEAVTSGQVHAWLLYVVPKLTLSNEHVLKAIFQTLSLHPGGAARVDAVAEGLRRAFPSGVVSIRQATAAADMTQLPRKSIAFKPHPAAPAHGEVIVELAFREAFAVPSPSPRYQQVLDLLPDVYAAPAACFFTAVRFIAEELELSFHSKGQQVPPWRTFQGLSSRWWGATDVCALFSGPQAPSASQCSNSPAMPNDVQDSAQSRNVALGLAESDTAPGSR